MAFEHGISYNDGNPSVGAQLIDFYWYRKAIIDTAQQRFFGQLADTRTMPKYYGKTIKQTHWIPLLDDRNINDQGIDATGNAAIDEIAIKLVTPDGMTYYAVGNGATAAAAVTAAEAKALSLMNRLYPSANYATYAAGKAALVGDGWTITGDTAGEAYIGSGNLYGSSKDPGVIQGRLPLIGEHGGRLNRVGFTRQHIEASIENFGFFFEYTEDELNFDNEGAELMGHITRESVRAANEIVEDCIQMDLLNGAAVVMYGGEATSTSTITAEGANPSVLTYKMLVDMDTILTENQTPKDTEIITGSTMTDTSVISSARYAYYGSELKYSLLKMTDLFGNQAWVPVERYGAAGKIARGETGSIASFRFIEVPKMHGWKGAGAAVTANSGYRETGGNYDVYPILIVGNKSFTTIGFQASKGDVKFRIKHQAPGKITRDDPYGKTGLYSIQWWYGTMITRPERIGLIKVVAEY